MKTTTFRFPKTVLAVAGAAAMMASTGFVSVDQREAKSSDNESIKIMSYRNFDSCRGTSGTCLPTVIVTE